MEPMSITHTGINVIQLNINDMFQYIIRFSSLCSIPLYQRTQHLRDQNMCVIVCSGRSGNTKCTVRPSVRPSKLVPINTFTGGSNKKGTKTDDVLKNIVYVELYNVDMGDWYGFHHILTKIEWEIFWKYFWPLEFKIWIRNYDR